MRTIALLKPLIFVSLEGRYKIIANTVQCGDASHDSFKGDTEISYIKTP